MRVVRATHVLRQRGDGAAAVARIGGGMMVRLAGIEPTTLGFGGQYSIH